MQSVCSSIVSTLDVAVNVSGHPKAHSSFEACERWLSMQAHSRFTPFCSQAAAGHSYSASSIRHADPSTIRVKLQRTRESICLSIKDDGQGFIADSHLAGFGLLGMRKRAESISDTLTVRSTPGSGTRVEVKSPIRSHLFQKIAIMGHPLMDYDSSR